MAGPVSRAQTLLEGITTTEARIAVSAVLLVVAGLFILLVAPWVIQRLASLIKRKVLGHNKVPVTAEDVSWIVPAWAVVRVTQVVTLFLIAVALLIVWGYLGLARRTVLVITGVLPTLGRVIATVALIGGALLVTDLFESWLDSYTEGTDRINQHQEGIIYRVLQLVVLIAAGLATLTVWNFNLGGLLVGAGFLGIVVGMAARQTLGSLIAGFVLMFSRPFEIGDWVLIDGHEGMVTDITIINTRIRNFDGETVVLPNDKVSNSTVINRTDRDRLRLTVEVGVDYDTDLDRAEDVADDALGEVDRILSIPSPQVIPTTFGNSAVGLELRFWIDNPSARKRWRSRAAVIRQVKAAFDREGIKIPFPQRELSGRAETGGFRVAREGGDAGDGAAGEADAPGAPDASDAPPGDDG